MYKTIARNIIQYFEYENGNGKLYLLADEAFAEIAENIKELHRNAEIRIFKDNTPEQVKEFFTLPDSVIVLLLAEPETYVKYKLFHHLDFSNGEPHVPNTNSRVLIFPKKSICRMFSGDISKSFIEKERLLNTMKEHQKYRITTAAGTDLVFESRHWIPLDFEVCTAPKESSINGVIVVDGALFFKQIKDTLTFVIKVGKLQDIVASSEAGNALVTEYKAMTANAMKDPRNTQLAEIGIGFCHDVAISDCFMEAEAVVNTCHFCFGNNVCYGGENESEFHGASVLIKNPIFTCI